ncbi:DNA topoisomerase, partial [Vibrio splendidus]
LPELATQSKEVAAIHNGQHSNYKAFVPRCYSKGDMEHHGIVPTTKVMTENEFAGLSPDKGAKYNGDAMRAAYVLVCKRYIQALYPPAQYATQKIEITVPCEDLLKAPKSVFRATGKRVVDLGWKAAFGASSKDVLLPQLKISDITPLIEAFKKSDTTKAPERYKESTFPDDMANLARFETNPDLRRALAKSEGIGTPATRSTIIETLKRRNYVDVKKGLFIATQRGIDLINSVPEFLRNATFTAKWEDYLIKLCQTRDDVIATKMRDEFVQKQRQSVESLINAMIDKYQGDLGERIGQTPKEVTANMGKAIKAICKVKGLNPPSGVMTDPAIAMMFITEHKEVLTTPSQAQIDFINKIKEAIPNAELPEGYEKDKKTCSAIIEKYKDEMFSKPTPGMVKYMNDMAAKCTKPFTMPENAETNSDVCKSTIELLKKLTSNPITDGQLSFVNKIAEAASEKQQPTEDDKTYAYCASQYIEKYKNLLNSGDKGGKGKAGAKKGATGYKSRKTAVKK